MSRTKQYVPRWAIQEAREERNIVEGYAQGDKLGPFDDRPMNQKYALFHWKRLYSALNGWDGRGNRSCYQTQAIEGVLVGYRDSTSAMKPYAKRSARRQAKLMLKDQIQEHYETLFWTKVEEDQAWADDFGPNWEGFDDAWDSEPAETYIEDHPWFDTSLWGMMDDPEYTDGDDCPILWEGVIDYKPIDVCGTRDTMDEGEDDRPPPSIFDIEVGQFDYLADRQNHRRRYCPPGADEYVQ